MSFLVDFIIIGAQKCGTTSVAHHLALHPEVCFCIVKEPGFFNKWQNWKQNVDEYHSLFKPVGAQKIGEASTMYTMAPEASDTHKRIYQYNPKIKLVYLMRDPVERIISHYTHRLARKNVKKSMDEEVLNDESYVNRSRYYYQINPYIKLFGKENLYLTTFERYVNSPRKVLMEIAEFLSISSKFYLEKTDFDQKNQSINRKIVPEFGLNKYFSPIKKIGQGLPEGIKDLLTNMLGRSITERPEFSEILKRELYNRTLEDRNQLEQMMGMELSCWKRY